ncbi:MAG: ATP-binding protein [Polaromonas sp.]|nr:ATP-binding protein [Polaromonas sp.]
MRLRIAHQLSLLLAAAVVLAVLAVGGLSMWNLRSGFIDYLRQRDEEQLTRLMQLVERHAATDPSMAWIGNDPDAMRRLMDEFNGRDTSGRRPGPPPHALGGPPFGKPGRPPPPPPGGLPERVSILDAQGRWLAGAPLLAAAPRAVRAIKVNGVEVARIELREEPDPEGVDARFLQRQYTGLAVAALCTIAAALLVAFWVAGRWSRPLLALQRASRDIAQGQRNARLQPTGALEIAQLMEDVNTMTDELARLEKARRLWIAQISHELRTPLAVLRGEIESIEDGARQPTPEVMASLRDEVLQLTRLVNDLHTLSMAELGGLRCEFQPGDASAALLRVAQRFAPRAGQRGLRLDIAPAPAITACWDFGRIEQLMNNLLDNSLRYTAAPGRLVLRWRQVGQLLELTLEDTAPGVTPEQLPQLFDPLFRADAARQRRGGEPHGSGLGLSIAQAIVHAHRGRIEASASALGGLSIRVSLPLQATKTS